ncbi:MAG: hypothetical protein AMXMBFR66_37210 [Pseudomonadota bacterium]|nr:DUF4390 domain-containing protein [Rubrivivax sp.]NLZ40162.1 DUF4390 domain-containing protein [Comamonadaceae bacterium]
MQLPPVRRRSPPGLAARLLLACWLWALALAASAQGVELASLSARRADGALELEFSARVMLPKAVEDALWRGVPLYFVAEATLLRSRWYWRDERVARVARSWRVAYQPLTGTWRVGLGGLNQSYGSLGDALTAASSSSGWKLADLAALGSDKGYYVEFDYRLDTSQLPGPMQFGLGGPGLSGEWTVRVERVLRLD